MKDANASASAERSDGTGPEARPPLRGGDVDADPPPPPSAPATNPAGLVFGFFPDEFRLAVVKDALRARKTNPGAARDRLNGRLGSTLRMAGFRNAAKAPPGQLAIPVLEAIHHGDDVLAAGILNLWALANAPLRDAALDAMRDAGVAPCAEAIHADFGGSWSFGEWLDHREAFASLHPDADPHAAGLMLAVAADRLPLPPAGPDIHSPRFLGWLDELDALPHDAQEWTDAEEFALSVFMLAGLREEERRQTARDARDAAVRGTAEDYADELRYLGIELDPWLADDAPDPLLASQLADELAAILARYRPVRPQGATRTEEAERCAARAELETAALAVARRWETLPRDAREPDDGGTEPTEDPKQGAAAPAPAELVEAHRELRAERDRLRADNTELAAERERLDLANASLRLAREQVDADNDRLRRELARANATEEQWRRAYVETRRADATDDEAGEQPIASVADALTLAERAFPDHLAVSLNAKSDPDVPFARPAEVFDALAWLATAYRRGPAAIAESCPGWFHKTDQSAATVGMYPDWYRTTYQGRTLNILQHVGKGASFDARSTIRIAFAWDDETDRVVVGYVGRHQRNRQS